MSLWGCDCPLPALAACRWRGMVCSWLALFSPLFCAWAWRCLKLGLALCVVAIPQFGWLAQVNSLRLSSGHSGAVLTLSHAACASLPSPRLLVTSAGVCAASPLGELPLGWSSVGFNYLFIFLPVMLPSASKACHRRGSESVSWCLETSLFLRPPSRDGAPSLSLVSIFCLLYFFLPPFEDNGLLFWVPDVLCQHSEAILWNLLSV